MYYFVHFLANCDIDQSRSPQSEKSAQNDSSRHSTTSGRKDTKYKLLYVSKRRGPAQDSSSTSDGLNNLGGSGKCVVSTKSCPPTQSTTTQNGSSPPKHNKNADEFQFRSAQQTVERGVISAEKSNSKGKSRQRNIILKGFSKKAQNTNQFPNSNNGAESIL